ncbi:MAG: lytic transglycosylase domain-containing protein, partial [Oscillospiraceae bacterium]|nr:lytic transglycosylase domain-containing protein [Oscillospiraceae bacterium]
RGFVKILIFLTIVGVIALFVLNYYDTAKNKFYEINYPQKYSEYVDKAARDYDLEPALIYAVIHTESGFDASAESSVGARGVMQIMPSSFEWMQSLCGCEGQYTEDDLYNPEICIDYGSYLLRYFLDLYDNEISAVAAYNAGFVVGDWLEDSRYSSDGVILDYIPYPETEAYVEKVLSAKEKYNELYFN